MNFFAWRRMRKQVRHLLHEARHARHMTEDIAEPALVDRVLHAETALATAWTARDNAGIESAADGLVEAVLSCNVGLADLGPVLPAGVVLRLPDFGTEAEVEQLITLWG